MMIEKTSVLRLVWKRSQSSHRHKNRMDGKDYDAIRGCLRISHGNDRTFAECSIASANNDCNVFRLFGKWKKYFSQKGNHVVFPRNRWWESDTLHLADQILYCSQILVNCRKFRGFVTRCSISHQSRKWVAHSTNPRRTMLRHGNIVAW